MAGDKGRAREGCVCHVAQTAPGELDTRKPQCSHGGQEPCTFLGFLPIASKSQSESFVLFCFLWEVLYFKISGSSEQDLS